MTSIFVRFTHGCNVWRYVLSSSLNWDILVFAKIDPSIPSAEQLHLQSFVSRSRDRPVDLTSRSAASIVAPSASHSVIPGLLPAVISRLLLPAIVAGANRPITLGVGVSEIPSIFLTAPIASSETPEVREINVAGTPRVPVTAASAPVPVSFTITIAISASISVAKRS